LGGTGSASSKLRQAIIGESAIGEEGNPFRTDAVGLGTTLMRADALRALSERGVKVVPSRTTAIGDPIWPVQPAVDRIGIGSDLPMTR